MKMKTKIEMSGQDSGKAPVTFYEVAASFSEEEWKLLHEWQKELYKIVMQEIHQALISLGPVIATSVFSLRAQEKEHLCPADHQDSDGSNHHPMSATLCSTDPFGIGGDGKQCQKDLQDTDRRGGSDHLSTGMEQEVEAREVAHHASEGERSTCPSSGHEAPTPITLFGINEEGESYVIANRDSERRENIISPSAGFLSLSTEAEASLMDRTGTGGGSGSSACSGDTHATCDSLVQSQEETLYGDVPEDVEAREIDESLITGDTHGDVDDFLTSREETLHSEAPVDSEAQDTEDSPRTDNPVPMSECSPCNGNEEEMPMQELELERKVTAKEEPFPLAGPVITSVFSLHHYLEERALQEETEKRTTVCQPETEILKVKAALWQPETGIMKVKAACKCTDCEKSFTRKNHPVPNQQIHTDPKPFVCTKCKKTFSRKKSLRRHQKLHMEERPFSCTECEKGFWMECDLLVHYNNHTIEKPFSCTECKKSFTRKSTLVIHLRTHTGDRLFSCTKCEKSYPRKSNLTRHYRIHTREGKSQSLQL